MKYILESKKGMSEQRRNKRRKIKKDDIFVENLRFAIVNQAITDYRTEMGRLHPDKYRMTELENFFLSDWFKLLTDLDGMSIINELRRQSGNPNLPMICAGNAAGKRRYE